ncbi:alpha-ketoglutarate-dependent dioxygenase alkB homolog 7, mitochondrial isoform X1 [Haliaeetus albicilla]|uniref:alpha-ketoglutarate-dependent dioxygenase alkB homolog 7, mitochondrial isoform X1 n=1 Tax=Haliaeetus albicilla TaxID=8969 RepID=UPI0037E786F8
MDSPGRAPSPAPEILLAEAAAGLCLSPGAGGDQADPPGTSPGDPSGDEPGGGCPATLEQELAALGLPPGGGPQALGGLLRLYREAVAGGARREQELRGLRQRLGPLQGSRHGSAWHCPTAQPRQEPREGTAQRRPRCPGTELSSAAPRRGARVARRAPRTAQRQQGAHWGSEPPPQHPPAPRQDPDLEQELQRLREEAAAGREVIALQHRCLQEAMAAVLAAPRPPTPGLEQEWGRLRRLQGALARERRTFTEAAERLAREWEQFEAERVSLLQQHFLSTPDPWDTPDPMGDPQLWGTPQPGGGPEPQP